MVEPASPPEPERQPAATANGAPAPLDLGISRREEPTLAEMSFPGCRAFPMTVQEHELGGRRLEFWDAETETAWELRDGPSPEHEAPSQSLAQLVERIAAVRGAPIKCFGSAGLLPKRDDPPRRVAHPDQIVYLRPLRAIGGAHGLFVGGYDAPDVVVEVDNTTDVRRNKLALYEAWDVREVWREVPDAGTRSRLKSSRPGLAIYLLKDGVFDESAESRAFPGWLATDIHRAMNEVVRSTYTNRVLERIGRRMGERLGTGPDDDPLLRALRNETRAQGHAQGHTEGLSTGRAEGREEGREEGRAEAQTALVRQLVQARGIAVSARFPVNVHGFAEATDATLAAAALACVDEEDFARRLRPAA